MASFYKIITIENDEDIREKSIICSIIDWFKFVDNATSTDKLYKAFEKINKFARESILEGDEFEEELKQILTKLKIQVNCYVANVYECGYYLDRTSFKYNDAGDISIANIPIIFITDDHAELLISERHDAGELRINFDNDESRNIKQYDNVDFETFEDDDDVIEHNIVYRNSTSNKTSGEINDISKIEHDINDIDEIKHEICRPVNIDNTNIDQILRYKSRLDELYLQKKNTEQSVIFATSYNKNIKNLMSDPNWKFPEQGTSIYEQYINSLIVISDYNTLEQNIANIEAYISSLYQKSNKQIMTH